MRIAGLRHSLPAGVMILIAINVVILVGLTFTNFGLRLSDSDGDICRWLYLPPRGGVVEMPWTVLTYMFTQADVLHAVFNMLWLYWFGMLLQNLTSPRTVIGLYVIAGLAGAIAYIGGSYLWPGSAGIGLEGASAAVMGIVTATACIIPDFKMNLFLLGQVKLKWIAIVTIAIFALGLTGSSAGAHIAHLGGVVAGVGYALRLRLRSKPKSAVARRGYISETDARRELDMLLDKVRRSGYGSLTQDEQRRLYELSRHI